jgi:UDP:flavonoid glycosyltransferase YjiC (YdhE family)
MKNNHILFIINGLGLGNATRCHAIIQELLNRGVKITIISSGNGILYFRGIPEIKSIYEVSQLHYGSKEGSISILKTLSLLPKYIKTQKRNTAIIKKVIKKERPDAVVIDSTYATGPMRRLNIPIIAVNNADFIVKNYYRMGECPPLSTLPQFLLVEMMDFLFHLLLVDVVISPSLVTTDIKLTGKFRTVGPLVRRGYDPVSSPTQPIRGVVMLSGSAFGSQVHNDFDTQGLVVDIIGRKKPKHWPSDRIDVTFHGKLLDNKNILQNVDLGVVNCGYSAVSECIHLRKPLVVVPIPNHSEQWVNAKIVENRNLGVIATENQIEPGIQNVVRNFKKYIDAIERMNAEKTTIIGREQAADIILEVASSNLSKA